MLTATTRFGESVGTRISSDDALGRPEDPLRPPPSDRVLEVDPQAVDTAYKVPQLWACPV